MKIGAPKEIFAGEQRVALTPASAILLQKLGYECVVETGAGLGAGISDKDYKDAGVSVAKTGAALWKASDIIIKVRAPEPVELKRFSSGQTLISFIWPAQSEELLTALNAKG
ncbi:MAG: NAD(P)(+) transhydrogenase (Re/Si-specific) subunit alpha, partial [Rhodobacteraceae bacterium]|nr:NAD(P)(+) transhydrogenase (Re/Si-specific) subunit alpha [Paracoccaceae bacterium]